MPPLRTCSIGKHDSSSLTVDFPLSESVHSVSEADVALPNTVDVCGAEHFARVQRYLSLFNCAGLPCPALITLFYVPFNLLLTSLLIISFRWSLRFRLSRPRELQCPPSGNKKAFPAICGKFRRTTLYPAHRSEGQRSGQSASGCSAR